MRWGIWGANHNISGVQNLIYAAVDKGFYTFDCADIYGDYTTEALFGSALKKMPVQREDVQLISKCGIQMPCGNRDYKVKAYNYSKDHILNSVNQSLKNLQTHYLDVLILHRPSPLMDSAIISEAFAVLKSQGKVLEFGVSNFSPSQLNLINDYFPLVTNQVECSLLETKTFYDGTMDQMISKKLQPMAWSPLGNYFSEESNPINGIKKEVLKLSQKYNCTEDLILLSFILKHPANILPVIGTSNIFHLESSKLAFGIGLENEDWFSLLEASNQHPVP